MTQKMYEMTKRLSFVLVKLLLSGNVLAWYKRWESCVGHSRHEFNVSPGWN